MKSKTNILAALILGAGAVAFASGGCELIASVDRTKISGSGGSGQGGGMGGTTNPSTTTGNPTTGGTPGTGGTTGTAGGGTGGGTGGTGGCMMPSDCPDPGVPCEHATCTMNHCGVGDDMDGTHSTCTGGKICLSGSCVECIMNSDCTTPPDTRCDMTTHTCTTQLCANGMQDPGETDVDCGGATCPKCGPNKKCLLPTDCAGGDCSGTPLKCQPNCNDGFVDQDETDVDCGGITCAARCTPGQDCLVDGDCDSGSCKGNPKKCQAASCSDGIQNEGETGIDCGGPCGACNGTACMNNSDCASNTCLVKVTGFPLMLCYPATCNDGMIDGPETDVDCGGQGACPFCNAGQACMVPGDCVNNVCTNMVCQ
jgi:hypothetical protein